MESDPIVCQKCGEKNPATNNFCSRCAAPLKEHIATPVNARPVPVVSKTNKMGCFILLAMIFILVMVVMFSCNGEEPTAPAKQNSTPTVGLNQATFETAVFDSITAINGDGVIGKVESRVAGENTAVVKLYLSNTDSWTATSELDRKEFINSVGSLMDGVAVSLTEGITVGVETQIYSPGGILLGTRSVLGSVKIEK